MRVVSSKHEDVTPSSPHPKPGLLGSPDSSQAQGRWWFCKEPWMSHWQRITGTARLSGKHCPTEAPRLHPALRWVTQRCLRLPWEVWPEMTSYQPGLMALQGHFLLLGVLPANHTASLCPNSLLCEEGHTGDTWRSTAEQHSSLQLKSSRISNHPLTSLTSLLSSSEMNLISAQSSVFVPTETASALPSLTPFSSNTLVQAHVCEKSTLSTGGERDAKEEHQVECEIAKAQAYQTSPGKIT